MGNEPTGLIWWNTFSQTGPELILKWFLVAGMVMYVFFALVMIRQVGIMTETFESEVNGTVKTFAGLHLLMALFLLIVAIVLL